MRVHGDVMVVFMAVTAAVCPDTAATWLPAGAPIQLAPTGQVANAQMHFNLKAAAFLEQHAAATNGAPANGAPANGAPANGRPAPASNQGAAQMLKQRLQGQHCGCFTGHVLVPELADGRQSFAGNLSRKCCPGLFEACQGLRLSAKRGQPGDPGPLPSLLWQHVCDNC